MGFYEQKRAPERLARAIQLYLTVCQRWPDLIDSIPFECLQLAIALCHMYKLLRDRHDLDEAIEKLKISVDRLPDNYKRLHMHFYWLGVALGFRSECHQSTDDINQAIWMLEQAAVRTVSHDEAQVPMVMDQLGVALLTRFELTRIDDDLELALIFFEFAVTRKMDPPILFNFAGGLHVQYLRHGLVGALNKCIRLSMDALKLVPPDDPELSSYHNLLGAAFETRSLIEGSSQDLDNAIIEKTKAVLSSATTDRFRRAGYLSNLGNSLQSRYEIKGLLRDLDMAIAANKESFELTSPEDPNYCIRALNFSVALENRFKRVGSANDLQRVFEIMETSLNLTPLGNRYRNRLLINLGNAFQTRFKYIKSSGTADLDFAIMLFKEGIKSTLFDDPMRTPYLNYLASALTSRSQLFGKTTGNESENAAEYYMEAFKIETAPPWTRIQSAHSAASLLLDSDRPLANEILKQAIDLLPMVALRNLRVIDVQEHVSKFHDLAVTATSLSIDCGDAPYTALRLLELGRGIVANLQIDVRTDLSTLKKAHGELGNKFEYIQQLLDQRPGPPEAYEDLEHYRVRIAEFNNLLAEIREKNGFQTFLSCPSETDIAKLSSSGPVVVINVSKIRSDAFLIQEGKIRLLSLPLLSIDDLNRYATMFVEATYLAGLSLKFYTKSLKNLDTVLKWLWDFVVEPIFDALGFTSTSIHLPSEAWPKIWWIGTGLLNVLPLHAAGYHDDGSGRTALDRVVSSYVPSLRSLSYAQGRQKQTAEIEHQNCLLISMPKTPGQRDLEGAKQEVEALTSLFSNPSTASHISAHTSENPTSNSVLEAIHHYQVVHFACHGTTSFTDPSQSAFLLADCDTTPLTVAKIAAQNISSSQFAYLSACHSAGAREFTLLNESINLSSAIQLAGFPSVVGTLWGISDRESVEVAEKVYNSMLAGGKLDTSMASKGLHNAVRNLREKTRICNRTDPLMWAPYVYIGA